MFHRNPARLLPPPVAAAKSSYLAAVPTTTEAKLPQNLVNYLIDNLRSSYHLVLSEYFVKELIRTILNYILEVPKFNICLIGNNDWHHDSMTYIPTNYVGDFIMKFRRVPTNTRDLSSLDDGINSLPSGGDFSLAITSPIPIVRQDFDYRECKLDMYAFFAPSMYRVKGKDLNDLRNLLNKQGILVLHQPVSFKYNDPSSADELGHSVSPLISDREACCIGGNHVNTRTGTSIPPSDPSHSTLYSTHGINLNNQSVTVAAQSDEDEDMQASPVPHVRFF